MRPLIYKFTCCLFLFLLTLGVDAQSVKSDILSRLQLNEALYPPEDILSTKSLVLVSVPEASHVSEWFEMLEEFQQFFAEVGLDAIAYLDARQYAALPNTFVEMPEYLAGRNIKNLILITLREEDAPIFIGIGPYTKGSFYSKGTSFWSRYATSPEPIITELDQLFKTGQFPKDNLLVNEYPEFFNPKLELGLVAKSIPPRLAEFKTYIEPIELEQFDDIGLGSFGYESLFKVDSLKSVLGRNNSVLNSIASDSTNSFYLKDPTKNTQQLRREGFQYALRWVKGIDTDLHQWIPHDKQPKSEGKIVYKFYLDDLRNNNIYVGKEWDADAVWDDALRAFMSQIDSVLAQKGD